MHKARYLEHTGTPHEGNTPHSGRYEYGTGKNPYQHEGGIRTAIAKWKAAGYTEEEMVKSGLITVGELRLATEINKFEKQVSDLHRIMEMKERGMSNTAIAAEMGINESVVRSKLKNIDKYRENVLLKTAATLKERVDTDHYIDIGKNVNIQMGISEHNLKAAIELLLEQGYEKRYFKVPQMGGDGNQFTTIEYLAKKGMTKQDWYAIKQDPSLIKSVNVWWDKDTDGYTNLGMLSPTSIDSKRVDILYAEDGGSAKDGVIELRRGVKDLSLGKGNYAQVRIAVDGTHYLKGVAMYSDAEDWPDGVDIVFNTSKSKNVPKMGSKDNTVLKPMKKDTDNPFGATIKRGGQRYFENEDGTKELSAINIVNEEGDWDTWSRTLSSQFLSKQPLKLISERLNATFDIKKQEYDEIMSLTNPTVKKKMLDEFASECDGAAVHLKAAGFEGQGSYLILPITSLKDTEVYAPNFENGEQVVLIRYPHEGTFEIPRLTVNNKNKQAQSLIGRPTDAIGINPRTAGQLSGADFDGDTVTVIPVRDRDISTTKVQEELLDFNNNMHQIYAKYPGMIAMTKGQKANEMGKISNLITDMTLKGASLDKLIQATKYSMVVIDAEKHELNYKQAYTDLGIDALKREYQYRENGRHGGASTLISKAGSKQVVGYRRAGYDPVTGKKLGFNSETGEKVWEYPEKEKLVPIRKNVKDPVTGEKTSQIVGWKSVGRTMESTKMYETEDAYTLSSGTVVENLYAEYANKLKDLANKARVSYVNIQEIKYDSNAAKAFAKEVESLKQKLITAKSNSPKERQAQIYAYSTFLAKKRANPDAGKDDLKKWKGQALVSARIKTGANKERVHFTDREWEAVQAGAISKTMLKELLDNSDIDSVKQLAIPRDETVLDDSKIAKIRALIGKYTQAEIASMLGISVSTVQKYAKA